MPEGYFKCFAIIYPDFADALRTIGVPDNLAPNAADGVRVIQFVEANIASSQGGSNWFRTSDLG